MTAVTVSPSQLRPADAKQVRRASWAGLVGTMLENYDFVIYGMATALIFNQLFFPELSPAAGMMGSFSAYAVGFLARPLGGLFFSHWGEKLGRKWVLVTTLFLMGAATLAIGFLPSYFTAGMWAPILLVLCRTLQGFGAGAEQSGGATLLTETAPLGKRGVYASFVQVGAALGAALGAVVWIVVQAIFPPDVLLAWGWRTIFWSSIVVTILAMLVRSHLHESPVFTELKKAVDVVDRAPLTEVWQTGRSTVLRVMGGFVGASTQSYMYQVFMASYLVNVLTMEDGFIPPVLLAGSLAAAVSAFVSGWVADKVGRRRWLLVLAAILTVTPFLVFPMINTTSKVLIAAVIIFGYIFAAQGITAPQMSYFSEQFGSRYRYAGVTLGREFGSVLGGGFAPLIGSGLLALFSNSWVPVAIYMGVMMAISFVATWLSPETRNRDLTLETNAVPGEAMVERNGSWHRDS